MSRLYDTVEPSVIDEEMLMRAVEEQGPKEEAGKIAKIEGIDFADVASLRLDFKSKIHYSLFQRQNIEISTGSSVCVCVCVHARVSGARIINMLIVGP